MSERSISRVLLITAGLCCMGAIQGALVGVLSLTPIWIEQLIWPPKYPLFEFWTLVAIAVIGARIGAVVGPAVGWVLLGRAPLWRILAEPTLGAVVGSWIAWVYVYFTPVVMGGITHLVLGAFLGAVAATARLRFTGTRRAPESGTAQTTSILR